MGLLYRETSRGNKLATNETTLQAMCRDHLAKGHVEMIQVVNRDYCRVILRKDAADPAAGKTLWIQIGMPEAFEACVERVQSDLGLPTMEHVPIQYFTETSWALQLLRYLPTLLFLVPLAMVTRGLARGAPPRMGGPGGRNPFNMGKAFAAGQKDVKSTVKFADVAGLGQAKKEVVEFVDFLKDPKKYELLGARPPKGSLLVGPTGTGKTLLAKAVAGEAGVPFFAMSGSEFVELFVGVGASRVRDLFQQARASAPSIIFIDEIDAIGRKRGSGAIASGGHDERESTLNQILVEMDGFSSGTGVVVMASTNRADILDPALIRPGRFDRQISVDKPDLIERQEIFQVHLKPITLDKALNADSVANRMAALTPGFVGADIANVCNEAAIFAARRNAAAVVMDDFEHAIERILWGLKKHNNLMSSAEKRAVALHESGHAVAGWFLEHADPLLKVSIVARSSGALGFAQHLPGEAGLLPKEAILDKIAVAVAGRAAEELFVGKITTGAKDDLDKVTKMAYAMVTVHGMCPELGLLSYSQQTRSDQFYKPFSEERGRHIDHEVRAIVDAQYERTKALLREKQGLVHALADSLAAKETLVYADLLEILGARPFPMKEMYRRFAVASGSVPSAVPSAVTSVSA